MLRVHLPGLVARRAAEVGRTGMSLGPATMRAAVDLRPATRVE